MSNGYDGRQFDIASLQPHTGARVEGRMHKSIALLKPAKTTGIQKAVNRYIALLFTQKGSVHIDRSEGSRFITDVVSGSSRNYGALKAAFAFASVDVLRQMYAEESEGLHGDIPDDEVIDSVKLISVNYDVHTRTAMFRVRAETLAGESAEYIVPSTGIV